MMVMMIIVAIVIIVDIIIIIIIIMMQTAKLTIQSAAVGKNGGERSTIDRSLIIELTYTIVCGGGETSVCLPFARVAEHAAIGMATETGPPPGSKASL